MIKAGVKLLDNPESVIEELLPALRERVDKPEIKLDNDKERQVFWFLSLEGRHIDHLIENSDFIKVSKMTVMNAKIMHAV